MLTSTNEIINEKWNILKIDKKNVSDSVRIKWHISYLMFSSEFSVTIIELVWPKTIEHIS